MYIQLSFIMYVYIYICIRVYIYISYIHKKCLQTSCHYHFQLFLCLRFHLLLWQEVAECSSMRAVELHHSDSTTQDAKDCHAHDHNDHSHLDGEKTFCLCHQKMLKLLVDVFLSHISSHGSNFVVLQFSMHSTFQSCYVLRTQNLVLGSYLLQLNQIV